MNDRKNDRGKPAGVVDAGEDKRVDAVKEREKGKGPGSDWYWDHGKGPGSKWYYEHGAGPGSKYYDEHYGKGKGDEGD